MPVVAACETEDDARIVAEAAEIVSAFDDELHVLTVLTLEDLGDDIGPGGPDEAARERLEREAASRAEAIASSVGATDVTPVGRVASSVAQAILDYVESVDTRYVVIGGRKRSPVGKALFGSTGQKVLLESTAPVLSVRDSE